MQHKAVELRVYYLQCFSVSLEDTITLKGLEFICLGDGGQGDMEVANASLQKDNIEELFCLGSSRSLYWQGRDKYSSYDMQIYMA